MFCPIFWYLKWGVCHAAGTNSGTSTRLSNSLMEVYTSSSSQSFFYLHQRQHRKPPTSYLSLKTVKIVPALSCVLYILSLPISVSSSQAVSCWGDLGVSESISLGAVESIILQWLTLQPAQDIGSDATETGIGDGIYANRFLAPTVFQVSEPVSMFSYWKSPLSQSGVFWEMYRGKWVMCPIPTAE